MARTKESVNFTISVQAKETIEKVRNLKKEIDDLNGKKYNKEEERRIYGASSIADSLILEGGRVEVRKLIMELDTLKSIGKTPTLKKTEQDNDPIKKLVMDWSDAGAKRWRGLNNGNQGGGW